jgi:predicted metalloprotease with PDZ domain
MPSAPIRYHVDMPEPQSHEFHVTMEIPALSGRPSLDIVFPAWAPGSYLVRDFSRHIYDLEIRESASRRSLPCERIDKLRWRVQSGGRPVTVRYRVFAFEISVRSSFLDDSHAFWNGTSLFFFVDDESHRPCLLSVQPPPGWQISTSLPSVRGRRATFRARDYDDLVDSPVEVGTHELLEFRVEGTPFEVALYGATNIDRRRMVADLHAITQTTGTMFGGFPFERYLFIIHALPTRGGGLEHACSCTLDIPGFSFEDEKGYQSFAELAAHEFFHTWNVKRIRDKVLGPFDYTKENYTRLLWFHEGFTEHMQILILLRAGLVSVERYLKDLAEDWTAYMARPGRNVTPLSALSFEAWIKQYKPAENHSNRMVSYYDKGRWAGLVLDLQLRSATDGRRGLPDLFQRLWHRYGAHNHGIDAAVIRTCAEAIAGRSLSGYFRRFIDGNTELPVPVLLRLVGVNVEARTPSECERTDAVKARRMLGYCGLVFIGNSDSDAAVVKNVIPDSPAWRAGITFGDEVIAVDGIRVAQDTVGRRLADGRPGQEIVVSYFRKNRLRSAKVRLVRNPERKWTFTLDPTPSPLQRRLRSRWLGTTTR